MLDTLRFPGPRAAEDLPSASVLTADLARRLARHATTDGVHPTGVPGVSVLRASRPDVEQVHVLHQPALCVVAQGAKRVMLGSAAYDYDASKYLVMALDLPVSGRVTRASPAQPYLCLRFDIEPARLAALLLEIPPARLPAAGRSARALYLEAAPATLLEPVLRLVRLLEAPDDLPLLAPLAMQEILIRLLTSPNGACLAQGARREGHAGRIAQAIDWLKAHFVEPMRIDELAARVHMSPSSLHHHFRAVTTMSPLQFQKQLRLQEARRLLMGGGMDVASAAYRVGYESPSQFTREYGRLFGASPLRDLHRLGRSRGPG